MATLKREEFIREMASLLKTIIVSEGNSVPLETQEDIDDTRKILSKLFSYLEDHGFYVGKKTGYPHD